VIASHHEASPPIFELVAQEAQKKLSSFAIRKSTSRGTPTNSALPKVIKTRTMILLSHLFLAIISRIQATLSSVLKS
jgi:hypothetical protein